MLSLPAGLSEDVGRGGVGHAYLKGVHGAGAHDLAAVVHGERDVLHGLRAREGAEVAVAHQVEGAHRAVQAGAEHRRAAGQKVHGGHGSRVLLERHEARAAAHVPHLMTSRFSRQYSYKTRARLVASPPRPATSNEEGTQRSTGSLDWQGNWGS
jgi:hypothetical protein